MVALNVTTIDFKWNNQNVPYEASWSLCMQSSVSFLFFLYFVVNDLLISGTHRHHRMLSFLSGDTLPGISRLCCAYSFALGFSPFTPFWCLVIFVSSVHRMLMMFQNSAAFFFQLQYLCIWIIINFIIIWCIFLPPFPATHDSHETLKYCVFSMIKAHCTISVVLGESQTSTVIK